jgi:hypothetical protein
VTILQNQENGGDEQAALNHGSTQTETRDRKGRKGRKGRKDREKFCPFPALASLAPVQSFRSRGAPEQRYPCGASTISRRRSARSRSTQAQ